VATLLLAGRIIGLTRRKVMKRSAPLVGQQWNLPLVDMAALPIPEQQQLALALMELLIQAARQAVTTYNHSEQEGQNESQSDL
jgi:hypothetical protein